jgi:O-methyltransferase involved in polyketide biosynthesis
MSKTVNPALSGVAETLLLTLYLRAMESQRPDALIKDERAVALIGKIGLDFSWVKQIPLSEDDKVAVILRSLEFDRYARDFLACHSGAVVVHIGCGLDSRFERVDDGHVQWYDLDFPDVIKLRRKLMGDEGKRHHLLACSALDKAWLDRVGTPGRRPRLFLAEGVSMYLEEVQFKSLVQMLRDHFQGSELVFDAFSPLYIWSSNFRASVSGLATRFPHFHWGLWSGQEIEAWGEGIHLLDEWCFLDRPEPRLEHVRWLRYIPAVARAARVYHFRLGDAPARTRASRAS